MSNIIEQANDYFSLQQAIFDHCKYKEGWRVIPINDCRDHYWAVDRQGQRWFRHSPNREALLHWLEFDEYETLDVAARDALYQSRIYTQRHHAKWVYRGDLYALAMVDTNTDGNLFLELVTIERELKALPGWEMHDR